eukprot:scaffold28089_cov135-Isochrysis_galbana.AAC.3
MADVEPLVPPPSKEYLQHKRKAEAAAGRAPVATEPLQKKQAAVAPTKLTPTTWATIAGERSCCRAFSSTNVFCTLRVRDAAPMAGMSACGDQQHSQPTGVPARPPLANPDRRRCCSSSPSSPSGCPWWSSSPPPPSCCPSAPFCSSASARCAS